jgi:hypothetical protein
MPTIDLPASCRNHSSPTLLAYPLQLNSNPRSHTLSRHEPSWPHVKRAPKGGVGGQSPAKIEGMVEELGMAWTYQRRHGRIRTGGQFPDMSGILDTSVDGEALAAIKEVIYHLIGVIVEAFEKLV